MLCKPGSVTHGDLSTGIITPVRIKKGTRRGYFSRTEGHNKTYNKNQKDKLNLKYPQGSYVANKKK